MNTQAKINCIFCGDAKQVTFHGVRRDKDGNPETYEFLTPCPYCGHIRDENAMPNFTPKQWLALLTTVIAACGCSLIALIMLAG